MKKVLLLGASGSIGQQTLDIIDENKDDFELVGFSVGHRSEVVPQIIKKYKTVKYVYLIDKEEAKKYSKAFPSVKFYYGNKGLKTITQFVDYEMCVDALVGFVGFEPALIALKRNKILCLANKEALVAGGTLINDVLQKGKGKLYPIDSEHVAIAKCLANCNKEDVKCIHVTASGGALRDVALDKLQTMTSSDALNHPTWKMGAKITIDCATMMNKGFELIEAYYLYGFKMSQLSICMHDESLIHSAVELIDGTYLVDFGKPDMHNPIRWAMYEGKRFNDVIKTKSLKDLEGCHFRDFDPKRYPLAELAMELLKKEIPSKMIAMNAANEVAVNRFLKNEIKYLEIFNIVQRIVENTCIIKKPSLLLIKSIDRKSRKEAMK